MCELLILFSSTHQNVLFLPRIRIYQAPGSSLQSFDLLSCSNHNHNRPWSHLEQSTKWFEKKKYSKVENLKAYWKCNPSGKWHEFCSDALPPWAGAGLKLFGPQRLESQIVSAARAIAELGLNLGLVPLCPDPLPADWRLLSLALVLEVDSVDDGVGLVDGVVAV